MAIEKKLQPETLKYIVSVRTALSAGNEEGKEGSVIKELPQTYIGKNHKDVLAYMTNGEGVDSNEMTALTSIRAEMGEKYTLSVNKKTARLNDRLTEDCFVRKTRREREYKILEYEIASAQSGGL